MELYWIVMATLLLSTTKCCESAILTIIPESLSITNNTGNSVSVTVKCSPGNNGYLSSLNINRNLTTNPTNEIRMAAAVRPDDNVQIITTIPGATASGSLTEGTIMVTMTQVSCNDAGTYKCKVNYLPQGAFETGTTTEDKNFTVQVQPGQITLIADPQNIYELNTTVTMTCKGQVGSITSGTEISWVWEYHDYQDSTWYSYMTDIDITPPTSSLPDSNCQITQVSVLTRRLTLEDSKRIYRCYVRRNGQSFPEFAGMYQIGTISSIDKTPSANTGTNTKDTCYQNDSSNGLALGIGCTLGVVIIIIVVALVWMWRLKWVLPCAETVTNKPEKSERALSQIVNYGLAEESQTSQAPGNDGTYDELKTNEIGQSAPYSKWRSTGVNSDSNRMLESGTECRNNETNYYNKPTLSPYSAKNENS